ncbi:ABC transporter permease subunit [Faecalibacillus intestinalis]|uniref:ABC transporter permease subunit n=1 Tax=Faecalibacillus intestinalis TaxID=1982626 RepID=UPI003994CECF
MDWYVTYYRAQVLRVKEEEFVLASRTLGASNLFIIFKRILPNIYSQMIIMIVMSIPNAIFYETYLSFVGLVSYCFIRYIN